MLKSFHVSVLMSDGVSMKVVLNNKVGKFMDVTTYKYQDLSL
jgi:hypothetical protein